jgi:RluA family pseudouridine synthase
MKKLRFCAQRENEGQKLPAFLAEQKKLNLSSLKKARELLEQGRCSVNGMIKTFSSTMIHEGDIVEVIPSELKACKEASHIVYEGEDFFIVDKSPSLQCEQKAFEKVFSRPCYLVHRLDKETSGLLMVAKSAHSALAFQMLFAQRKVAKQYLAIVDGKVALKGSIRKRLDKQKIVGSQMYWGVSEKGKEARSDYTPLCVTNVASLLSVRPYTGRTHQIRIHLASIGHPILGDYQYGSSFVCPMRPSRHMLHSWKLFFVHPLSGEEMVFQSGVPKDFAQVAEKMFGVTYEEYL